MLNFKIAVLNVPFDNSYTNVIECNGKADQRRFFKVDQLFQNAPACNFNVSTFLDTTVTVDAAAIDLKSLLNYNYAIVQDNTNSADINYYFYFVKDARQLSGNRIQLDLELDVYQTFYLDTEFENSKISRALISRFNKISPTSYVFNFTRDSNLHKSEGMELPKRCVHREKLNFVFASNLSSDDPLNTYFNGMNFVYIYLNKTAPGFTSLVQEFNYIGMYQYYTLPSGFILLCAPLSGDTVIRGGSATQSTFWNASYLFKYIRDKSLSPYVLAVKISSIPPFKYQSISNTAYEISDGTLIIKTPSAFNLFYLYDETDATYLRSAVSAISQPPFFVSSFDFSNYAPLTFSTITNDPKCEPKRLQSSCTSLRISDCYGNYKDFDVSKLFQNVLNLQVIEIFSPAQTKTYIEIINSNNNCVLDYTALSAWVGFNTSLTDSLLVGESQLDSYIANNKNFELIAQNNYANQLNKSIRNGVLAMGSGALAIAGGNKGAGALGILGGAAGIINANADIETQKNNLSLTLDNMASAPEEYNGASNEIMLPYFKDNGVYYYCEFWEAIPTDMQTACEFWRLYGYKVDILGNIKDYDFIRDIYDYIEADITGCTSANNLSNTAREKFKDIFARGVRMWHSNNKTYDNFVFNYNSVNMETFN